MKNEIKVEIKNSDDLKKLIESSYFEDGTMGKLVGRKSFLSIGEESDLYIILKSMNNLTIKGINENLIDGSIRFMVEEDNDIKIYPISIYCVKENGKYIFY